MTRLTPRIGINLQAAKKAAAERYFAIAMKYLPEGYRVEYRKSLSGLCYGGDIKLVKAPRPVTRKSLYIFLHECVHAVLGHYNSGKPRHVEEMEAEKWTHKTMRENGVPVPRKMTKRAKAYVRRKIKQAQRRGAKSIDKQAFAS